ncbi:MAG: HAMP domain-containing histidine kinase [Phycisphaerae bacterium]|nr:HAMP domain-containing histidine kinase [Phycisphaerae bacterium]
MTLRQRLMLVYLVVVLLSCATVGLAVLEIRHSGKVVDDLRRWEDTVLKVEKLRTAFERDVLLAISGVPETQPATLDPEEADFLTLLNQTRAALGEFDLTRWGFSKLLDDYENWRSEVHAGTVRPLEATNAVRQSIEFLNSTLSGRMRELRMSAQEQDERTVTLLAGVMLLTLVHIAIVGAILRRWFLRPMERLGRQVAALARDEAPSEPLVASPPELAQLATAMEQARFSLDAMRKRLIESERMTTVGEFATQLAHNLRNPLASIRAAAQVAGKRGEVDDYARARLGEIIAAADRLNRWVLGLTEFVRPRPSELASHDIVALVRQVKDAVVAELASKELVFEIVAPAEPVAVPHEPPSLEQALIAAVGNAIDASPVGGRIIAEVAWVEQNGRRGCRVAVIDEGSGLPVGEPEQVFELNFSTKEKGLGIGLSLARQAVQRQGGMVAARPNPVGGTIVEFWLPALAVEPTEGTDGANSDR